MLPPTLRDGYNPGLPREALIATINQDVQYSVSRLPDSAFRPSGYQPLAFSEKARTLIPSWNSIEEITLRVARVSVIVL
jgi:hypothetical protein